MVVESVLFPTRERVRPTLFYILLFTTGSTRILREMTLTPIITKFPTMASLLLLLPPVTVGLPPLLATSATSVKLLVKLLALATREAQRLKPRWVGTIGIILLSLRITPSCQHIAWRPAHHESPVAVPFNLQGHCAPPWPPPPWPPYCSQSRHGLGRADTCRTGSNVGCQDQDTATGSIEKFSWNSCSFLWKQPRHSQDWSLEHAGTRPMRTIPLKLKAPGSLEHPILHDRRPLKSLEHTGTRSMRTIPLKLEAHCELILPQNTLFLSSYLYSSYRQYPSSNMTT